ncbi:hypothetical protein BDF21DRAFT_329038 [Thamnidium elegans]|uniref:peptide-methionine (S)-S-oxide reductase n=1 Tax=Thamnidium elegans TaxID=101142 RepID=A0A8H7VWP4_9FUNG|nr:hypothetical protein INT48_005987 [Thamnidium elegans]KAI8095593.1 hypothetical protein BDF21DRAFT_329038 [Thamnidium elegans]
MPAITIEKATFAAGCFWGVEHIFNKHFKDIGIVTRVGYIGGELDNPSYALVKTGTTNHAEACEITYDPSKVSYETLVEFFYKLHDPTTANFQGPDIGTQYRSGIFYHNDEQKAIAERVTVQVKDKHYPNDTIVTTIEPATTFYNAEDYHQLYLQNNPEGYACPTHYLRW